MPLFNRSISLEVQAGVELIIIKHLRVDIKCVKTETSDTNNCTITIYNLSDATLNKFKNTDINITVKAGYTEASGEGTIFKGNTTSIYTKFEGANKITTIILRDGEKELNNSLSSVAYKEGTGIKQILKKAVKTLGLPLKTNLNLINFKNIKFNNAFSFGGMTKNLIEKLTKSGGLQWSVQNQEIKFYLENTVDKSIVLYITPKSGMIGSPEKVKIKKGKKEAAVEIDGWKIVSLLQPKIEPGGTVGISSRQIPANSLFRVMTVTHTASLYEGVFQTELEVANYE